MTTEQSFNTMPPVEDLTEARRRLFETAIQLFGASGFHAVSVKDLMTAIGQQPGALYFHVASKQDLLMELVDLGTRFHRTQVRRALLESGSAAPDQLRGIVAAHVRAHLEYRDLARVTIRERRSLTEDQQARVADAHQETTQIFRDVVDRGIRNGDFQVPSPELAIRAIASMGVRACEWWTPEDPHPMAEVVDQYSTYALKIVARVS
ncbi:TetR/AcrR family transcriptional regulator [Kribbella sp. NPDC056861]|uniref:TetR/AcrR family transcriptional regulator n=1 Tax=Kribbella sp. NPDC056861 TaxID=3154857 RepID=UPI0034354983